MFRGLAKYETLEQAVNMLLFVFIYPHFFCLIHRLFKKSVLFIGISVHINAVRVQKFLQDLQSFWAKALLLLKLGKQLSGETKYQD